MIKRICLGIVLIWVLGGCAPASPVTPAIISTADLVPTEPPTSSPTSIPTPAPTQTPALAGTSTSQESTQAGQPSDRLSSPDGSWTAIINRGDGSLVIEGPLWLKQTLFPAGSQVNDAEWSQDGAHLAVAVQRSTQAAASIHFLGFSGGAIHEEGTAYQAQGEAAGDQLTLGAWSPDDRYILFWPGSTSASLLVDGLPLWSLNLDGLQATHLSQAALVNKTYQSWAPDSSALVFSNGGNRSAQVGKWLSLYRVSTGQVTTLIDQDQVVPGAVAWSPDGKQIAFAAVAADQTGQNDADDMSWDNPAILARRIYLLDPQSGEFKRLNSTDVYQDAPRWSVDGKTLYYVQIDNDQAVLMAADPANGEGQSQDGVQADLPDTAGYYGQVDWSSLFYSLDYSKQATSTPGADVQSYTDPAGQFSVLLPAQWQSRGEAGSFYGQDGEFHTGYLPDAAYVYPVNRVCEQLANSAQGQPSPLIYPSGVGGDSCLINPYRAEGTDLARLVVANPNGDLDQRYFYLDADPAHIETIATSLQLLHPVTDQVAFPYPTGPMRPGDQAFWAESGSQPADLTIDENAVVSTAQDSPTHMEFRGLIPQNVLQKHASLRDTSPDAQLADVNEALAPFAYSLQAKTGTEMDQYALYHGDELMLDGIADFHPISVNASGTDFAILLDLSAGGYKLVQADKIYDWDWTSAVGSYLPPVYVGDDLLNLVWARDQSQIQVWRGDQELYGFTAVFTTSSPAKGLWSWEGHWILEVDGFLIQDGVNLNQQLGYDEIFDWQLLNGKPFYYFRKGPRVGISYDGQVLPVYYDQVVHYRCCEPAMFNASGNNNIVWFYGQRNDTWYYVEMGNFQGQ